MRKFILCTFHKLFLVFNPLNAELNTICQPVALLGAHHILHVSRVRVKLKVRVYEVKAELRTYLR
jgi:hypothetical protein